MLSLAWRTGDVPINTSFRYPSRICRRINDYILWARIRVVFLRLIGDLVRGSDWRFSQVDRTECLCYHPSVPKRHLSFDRPILPYINSSIPRHPPISSILRISSRQPTIDRNHAAGNIATVLAEKERDQLGYFLWGAVPAHGHAADDALAVVGGIRVAVAGDRIHHWGVNWASVLKLADEGHWTRRGMGMRMGKQDGLRSDGIDADVLRSIFHGCGFGHANDGVLNE